MTGMGDRVAFLSLFAGIGGFDLGFKRAGMICKQQVEIDDRCNEVLAHHWPDIQRFGDVRDVGRHNLKTVDLIAGGFPCQDVSVAGKRTGLAGERSGLWFEFHRVLEELGPRWVVVENVPGLLSSNGGRDFAVILRGLVELGYGVCWRVFDAQYDGVAQRRRRVFVVGSLGDGCAAEVLFERESSAWDPPPGRETGKDIATTVIKGAAIGRKPEAGPQWGEFLSDGSVYTLNTTEVHGIVQHALSAHNQRNDPDGEHFVIEPVAATLVSPHKQGELTPSNIARALRAGASHSYQGVGVRRLTPTECERLQGFPDGWTAVNGMKDSPRYRMLGNAVCVPVAEWISRRIVMVEGQGFDK